MAKFQKNNIIITKETILVSPIKIINCYFDKKNCEYYTVQFFNDPTHNVNVLTAIVEESYYLSLKELFNKV